MKIAHAADLAGRERFYLALLEAAWRERCGAVVLAGGDLLPPDPAARPEFAAFLARRIEQFRRLAPACRVLWLSGAGDVEGSPAPDLPEGLLEPLAGRRVELDGGFEVVGWGPPAAGVAEEEDLGRLPFPRAAARVVVALHRPPLGTRCDLGLDGRHEGSAAARAFLERRQPFLALCGGAPDSPYKSGTAFDRVGRTVVSNPGSGEVALHAVFLDLAAPAAGARHTVFGTEHPFPASQLEIGPA